MDPTPHASEAATDDPSGPDPTAQERAHDDRLVARAAQGDGQAFEELYERHRKAVFKVAFGMTRNEEDALDVVQQTFVKAHRALPRFERRAAVGTWLCQIAVHQAIDLSRRRKVRQAEPFEEGRVSGREESPRRGAQERELQDALDRALNELSEKHRTVFVLYTVEGLAYKEIAEALDISVGTVMSRLFYARKNLQGLLAQFAPR